MHKIPVILFAGLIPCLLFGAKHNIKTDALTSTTKSSHNFVTRNGNKLMLNGREYRAIGVNMPNLHLAYFGTWHHSIEKYGSQKKAKKAMITGVKDASANGFKFIRFFANPGYPKSIDLLYAKNPARYWKLMDERSVCSYTCYRNSGLYRRTRAE